MAKIECTVCKNIYTAEGRGKYRSMYCTKECKLFARKFVPKDQLNKVYLKFKNIKNCPICERVFRTDREKCVDHCHATGYVKGIICRRCNSAIGFLQDDYNIVSKALEYLTEGNIDD